MVVAVNDPKRKARETKLKVVEVETVMIWNRRNPSLVCVLEIEFWREMLNLWERAASKRLPE